MIRRKSPRANDGAAGRLLADGCARRWSFIQFALGLALMLSACQSPSGAGTPAAGTGSVIHNPTMTPSSADKGGESGIPDGQSTLVQAFQHFAQHDEVKLILVSRDSTGLESRIYQDLVRRNFRMTTGPDEGFDTSAEPCHPNCLYAVREEADALAVEGWLPVIEHEYRHIVQSRNNPNLAADFREPNGQFTTYAAFSEACADYGLDVAPVYEAQARIDRVKRVLGPNAANQLDRACRGERPAYDGVRDAYDRAAGIPGSFANLFPPYS